jgi:hypothetical protein
MTLEQGLVLNVACEWRADHLVLTVASDWRADRQLLSVACDWRAAGTWTGYGAHPGLTNSACLQTPNPRFCWPLRCC